MPVSSRAWVTLVVVALIVIAGSLTFLQDRGLPRPTTYDDIGTELGGGRVERTEAGFAITAPDGWLAWEPAPAFGDWWGADSVVELWTEPAGDGEWWMGACGVGEDCTRDRMAAAGGQAYCWVVDDTARARDAGWTDLAEIAAATAAGLARQEGWTGIGTAVEERPDGMTAAMVHATDPNGWDQTIYHLNAGERWFRLVCGVIDSTFEPRSVAATFEILPASG